MKKKVIFSILLTASLLTACVDSEDSTSGLYTVSESSATTQTVTMPQTAEEKPDGTEPAEASRRQSFELHTDSGVRNLIVAEYDIEQDGKMITEAEFYTGEEGGLQRFEADGTIYFSAQSWGVYVSKTQNYIADNSNFVRYRFNYDDMTVTAEYDKLYDHDYLVRIMDTVAESFADKEFREKMQFNNGGAYWNNVRIGVLTEEAVEPMNEYLLSFGYDPDAFEVVVDTSVAVPLSGSENDTILSVNNTGEKPSEPAAVKNTDGERAPMVMMSVYGNWAWGFQQTVYALDAEGNYYKYGTKDEAEYFNINTEDWYDRLSALEPIERNEYYYTAGEKSLKAIADFSEKLSGLYEYRMREYREFGSADGGTTHVYGIFAEKDGTPQYVELCSFGDITACLENNDTVDFVNACYASGDLSHIFNGQDYGFEFYYPDVYPDLPPMEEKHEIKVREDFAKFVDSDAEYAYIYKYYGTYNGWDALVMESRDKGYTDDEKAIRLAGCEMILPSGGLTVHM